VTFASIELAWETFGSCRSNWQIN